MDSRLTRGGAAALLTFALGTPVAGVAAQAVAPARVRGDTAVFRVLMSPKQDSIIALARALDRERYGSAAWLDLSARLDSMVMAGAGPNGVFFRRAGGPMLARFPEPPLRGWIGINAQGPNRQVIDDNGDRITYLAYPSVLSVDPDSPADRAGIAPGDLLVAFNGLDVVGREFDLTKLFVPEKKLDVTIRRDGDTKEFSLEILRAPQRVATRRIDLAKIPGAPVVGVMRIDVDRPEAPEPPPRVRIRSTDPVVALPRNAVPAMLMAGRFSVITPHGVWGANVSPVGADLAQVLRLERGVLVNEVPEESAAYRSGLRAGDVIVSASGQSVATLGQLQDQILSRLGDRSVVLQIVRAHKPTKLTVTW